MMSRKRDRLLRAMEVRDTLHLMQKMDEKQAYIDELRHFIGEYGVDALPLDKWEELGRQFSEEELADIEGVLSYANWRLDPTIIKELTKAGALSAKARYKRGERI